MSEPTRMADYHARLEKLERRVKILETTLEFFFAPQHSYAEMEKEKHSEEYP